MAEFCVAFPGFKPADYWALTKREYEALANAYNRAHSK